MNEQLTEKESGKKLQSISELLGACTHALKGILNGLNGGLYLTESGAQQEKRDRITEGLLMLRRNSAMARNLVAHVLYYTKDRDISLEEISLEDAVSGSVEAVSEYGIQGRAIVETSVEEGVFESDPDMVRAILVNLMDFALSGKVGPDQGASLILAAGLNDGHAEFEISFPEDQLDLSVIEPVLAESFSPKGLERKRLVLHMAALLALRLGGTVSCRKEETGACVVTVFLPLSSDSNGDKG